MDSAIQLFYWTVARLIQLIRPFLVPLCRCLAWGFVAMAIWHVVAVVHHGVARARRMHQIPCARCAFFTNNPVLKCPVHPDRALSEMAIGCGDYEQASSTTFNNHAVKG